MNKDIVQIMHKEGICAEAMDRKKLHLCLSCINSCFASGNLLTLKAKTNLAFSN